MYRAPQTSEKVPCAAEQSTENAKNVDRDDGCSGKPSRLGMQASEQLCLQEAEGYVDAVTSSQLCREVNSPFVVNSNRKRHVSFFTRGRCG